MKNNKLRTYSLAKNISYEILIEEQLQLKSEATSRLLEKYNKRRTSLKVKFLSYKIINAIIFGILPIFPLMAYIDISRFLVDVPVHHQISILMKSLTFEIFFTLQFLDFFLMGIFNLINIMSGEIFEWFKTLPLPRKKLKRLAFLTIFHNFDLPILANTFIFPIIMLFITQNIIVFLIALGTSILNITFSISVLIILGEKIAKLIRRQSLKAKKSILIQVLNTFSYVIIIFGSIFIIQMILNSLVTILIASLNLYYSPLYNAILSLIPFPFNPSYLISFFTTTTQMDISYWLNPLFGLWLYIIVIYVFFRKALKSLSNIISLKYKVGKSDLSDKKDTSKIHVTSTIKAFLRKDLLIASRNIQTFMSFIMPIIMSFVFMIFFNISYAGGGDLLSRDLYYNWIILLGFSLVISSITVHNLLNMEITGKTIIGSLPIVFRDHAKAKLINMILIQLIATLAPVLVYIFHYRFMELLLTVLATLPFVLIFLILTFLLRVRLFGKRRYSYVLEEFLPENKISKWTLIFVFEYFLYYLILVISNFLYFKNNFIGLFFTLFIISAIFTVILISIFNKFFPKLKKQYSLKEEKSPAKRLDSKSIGKLLSIISIYIIYFFTFLISILVYDFIETSFFFGGLLILTGLILILEVIKTPKKQIKKKSHQINLKNKKLTINKLLLITSIRIIYFPMFFIFLLIYSFFGTSFSLGGLFILIAFVLILEVIISSLKKDKKKLNQIKIKDITKKKSIFRSIGNLFFKHLIILFGLITFFFFFFDHIISSKNAAVSFNLWEGYFWNQLSIWERYVIYLKSIFLGNWGYLITPISEIISIKEMIFEYGSITLVISIIPICLGLIFDLYSCFLQNHKKSHKKIIRIISLIVYSIPSFLLIIFFIYSFNIETIDLIYPDYYELNTILNIPALVLASLILSIFTISNIAYIKRRKKVFNIMQINSALVKTNKNKIKTQTPFKSIKLSNSLYIPSIIFSEVIIVEKALNIPGLGYLFITSIFDNYIYIASMGIFFLFSIAIVIISFLQTLIKYFLQIKFSKNIEINE